MTNPLKLTSRHNEGARAQTVRGKRGKAQFISWTEERTYWQDKKPGPRPSIETSYGGYLPAGTAIVMFRNFSPPV
jgi:hypothetical protein